MNSSIKLLSIFGCLFFFLSCSKQDIGIESNHQPEIVYSEIYEAYPDADKEIITLPSGVTVEKMDSIYIFQGDVILSKEQLAAFSRPGTKSAAISPANYWYARRVYYIFDSGFPHKNVVEQAIQVLEEKTSLDFIEGTGYGNYIKFYSGSGNNSSLGMIGGEQLISIQSATEATVVHEICHAIGLFHEQCRIDRDNYITIFWDNIKPEKRHNFDKYNMRYTGYDIGPFDFNSIMIYGSYTMDTDFVYDINQPMMLDKSGNSFHSKSELSSGDIAAIASIYGPPYHKMTRTLTKVVQDYVDYLHEVYEAEYIETIEFFEDEACTIPAKLTLPRHIRIKLIHQNGYNGNISTNITYEDIIIPAGTQSYTYAAYTEHQEYLMSNPDRIDTYNYSIVNSHF